MSLGSDYNPSDSDEDYNENEKILLNKFRKGKDHSDDEQEVYGVGPDDSAEESDNNDASDIALSDVEGQEDDQLPDIHAWGKNKKAYYNTGYVDAGYGVLQEKDAQLAEFEEDDAKILEGELVEQFDQYDYKEHSLKTTKLDAKQAVPEKQTSDVPLKKSAEFLLFVESFQNKMAIAKDFLYPVLKKSEENQIPQCKALDFVQTYYELILNFNTNIYMYFLLKSTEGNLEKHPISKRLYQYGQLFERLDPVYEEIIKPQIDILLSDKENLDTESIPAEKKSKKLKLLSNITAKTQKRKAAKLEDDMKKKKVRFSEDVTVNVLSKANNKTLSEENPDEAEDDRNNDNMNEHDENEQEQEEQEQEGSSKRAITYEMAKNKGLTPRRKKEQRNPRVKHKLKYRKALIRRKGAVREPRNELTRYSGEISGIKATVSRSIKIKT